MEMDSSQRHNVGEIDNTQTDVKCNYRWKIKNFSDIINSKEINMITSPLISTKTKPEYHFKFMISFSSIIRFFRIRQNFKMALLSYNDTALEIKFSFSFINSNLDKKTSLNMFNLKKFGSLILLGRISEVEKLLINDEITILCEIEIDMNSKYNKQLSDVNIIIDDKKFFVHKDILANSSEVFDAMFKHDMKENQENLIKIEDIEWEIFNEILQYIYLKKTDFNSNDYIKLLAAADKYAIEELKNICENNLCKNITLRNVFEYLNVADRYILNKLKKETIAFIKLNKSQLAENKLIHSVADLPKDVLIEVVSALCNK